MTWLLFVAAAWAASPKAAHEGSAAAGFFTIVVLIGGVMTVAFWALSRPDIKHAPGHPPPEIGQVHVVLCLFGALAGWVRASSSFDLGIAAGWLALAACAEVGALRNAYRRSRA